MKMNSVKDVREFFIDELNDKAFTIDKTGARTIEMIGASFIADEPSIFGTPSRSYIQKELDCLIRVYDVYPYLCSFSWHFFTH
mgnify:CR=1 FL=1